MNSAIKDYLIYGIGVIISAILYTYASFYSSTTFPEPKNLKSWIVVIAIGVFFAAMEYVVKIPTYIIAHRFIEPSIITLIWFVVTFVFANLFQIFYLKQDVHIAVWIMGAIFFAEILLLVRYLKSKDK